MPGFPFQLQRRIDDFPVCLIALVCGFEFLSLQRLFQRCPRPFRDEFGKHIHFKEWHTISASDVLHRCPGSECPEGADLYHVVFSVLLPYVFKHFVPPCVCEVHIYVRHADAFRIQETPKEQAMFQGIERGDIQAV